MHKLEVTHPDVVQAALRHEAAHSPQWRFAHRLHCVLLVGAGRSCYEVAALFGDDPRSIERWVHEFQQFGIEALREKPHGGRHGILTTTQMRELELVLQNGPRERGDGAEVWNRALLRAEILQRFGVSMSARQCGRLFKRLARSRPQASD